MNKRQTREYAFYGALARRTGSDLRAEQLWLQANTLSKLIKKHDRACVRYCNEANYETFDADVKKIEDKINTILSKNTDDIRAEYQCDPRGWTVKLTWDGDTFLETATAILYS